MLPRFDPGGTCVQYLTILWINGVDKCTSLEALFCRRAIAAPAALLPSAVFHCSRRRSEIWEHTRQSAGGAGGLLMKSFLPTSEHQRTEVTQRSFWLPSEVPPICWEPSQCSDFPLNVRMPLWRSLQRVDARPLEASDGTDRSNSKVPSHFLLVFRKKWFKAQRGLMLPQAKASTWRHLAKQVRTDVTVPPECWLK